MPNSADCLTKHRVFTYGSLMFEDILTGVIGCPASCTPATLTGWQRYALKNRTYPGALPSFSPEARIEGMLWTGLSAQAIEALDAFESEDYIRKTVAVTTSSGQQTTADIYEWRWPESVEGQWDTDTFIKQHRASFLQHHLLGQRSGPTPP
jgi:gamma-glutamylcyclotransferase (GGCT)/AIG2-like uncharacterized protein YtfP